MRIRATVTCLSLAFLATAASAQQSGTVALGGYGSLSFHDDDSGLTDVPTPGLGGYLGIFLLPNLAVEGDISWVWTEIANTQDDVTWRPIRARLVYHIPASENIYPLIGAGYTRNEYRQNLDAIDDGVEAMLGLKVYVSDRLAFRTDVVGDYVWDPFNASAEVEEHFTWSLRAGFSLDLMRGRVVDSDGDGVRDGSDACPATPRGVRVDATGCRVDSDGDGVWDEDDRCSGTPAGARVDSAGCRVDADGDGVFDEDDRCPDTPDGVTVDASGCPVDQDGDGVPDHVDDCPGTGSGERVDARGCRVPTDGDGDGVFDEVDRCPNTPPGTDVDETGCPVLFESPEATRLVLEGVNFETGSARLAAGAQTTLDRVAESLLGNPTVRVRVLGHTDSTGPRALNLRLSQERAESVLEYLVAQGVARGRLDARGMGPDEPVATNDTAEGRAANRRVELERIN